MSASASVGRTMTTDGAAHPATAIRRNRRAAAAAPSSLDRNVNDVPRRLTLQEIDDIVNHIPPVLSAARAVAEYNLAEVRRTVSLQLREVTIRPSKIEKLKSIIYYRCMRAEIQPGDTVGLQAAESIGHPVTQGVLNSFHSSGSADVGATGLQIFTELLNLTHNRKVPIAEIHLKNDSLSFRDVSALTRVFSATSIKSLLKANDGLAFHRRSGGEALPTFYKMFKAFHLAAKREARGGGGDDGDGNDDEVGEEDLLPFESSGDVTFLRLTFDKVRLFETRSSLADIAATIEEGKGVVCVYSSTSEGILDVYARTSGPDSEVVAAVSCDGKILGDVRVRIDDVPKFKKPAPKPRGKLSRNTRPQRTEDVLARASARAAIAAAQEDMSRDILAANADADEADIIVTEDKVEAARVGRAGVTVENAPVLFLQTCVVPRIENGTFVVSSSESQQVLEKLVPPGRVVPPISRVLSLFRKVSVVRNKTLDILRGAHRELSPVTGSLSETWTIWVDIPKVFSTGIPAIKLFRLFEKVMAGKATVSQPRGRAGGGTAGSVIESFLVTYHSGESASANPAETVAKVVMDETKKYHEDLRSAVVEYLRGRAGGGTLQPVERNEIVTDGEYMSLTGKNNFVNVLSRLLAHPAVNGATTITNNFHEVSDIRGIEAARTVVFREFNNAIAATGSDINPRHVQLVVDVMVSSGVLMPFTARGSVRQKLGAYSDSSFEKALDAFRRSAVSGAAEPVAATSTSILTGSLVSLGTGTFRVMSAGGYKPSLMCEDGDAADGEDALGGGGDIDDGSGDAVLDDVEPPPATAVGRASDKGVTSSVAATITHSVSFASSPPSEELVSLGSQVFPPRDCDAALGVLSLREFLATAAAPPPASTKASVTAPSSASLITKASASAPPSTTVIRPTGGG